MNKMIDDEMNKRMFLRMHEEIGHLVSKINMIMNKRIIYKLRMNAICAIEAIFAAET